MSDDKKLMPEVLPTPPSPGAPAAASPQQRVNERARLLLDRFRGLGAATGAAILSMQCYSSVDPLPPPPMECTNVTNPFDRINAYGLFGYPQGDGVPPAVITFTRIDEVGLGVAAVRVTGGTLISVEDQTTSGPGGFSDFRVTIAPDAFSSSSLTIEIDFTCGDATSTRRYLATFSVPPMARNTITVAEL